MNNLNQQLPAKQRGSVMLFVVVLLVMLALIGTAYMQLARYDRIASTAGVTNHIGAVANATVSYISEVLTRDLLNDDRTIMFDGITDEPYDYPWTNNTDTANIKYPVEYYDVTTDTYLTANATGGTMDDTWLASTEPDFSGSTPMWRHITNLNGYFLRLPKTGSGYSVPVERVTDYTDSTMPTWHLDYDVPFNGATDQSYLDNNNAGNYDSLGVDVDNDGIYDSKWTWAPIRQISGVSYVMAVRIVDNSAMINANTAMGQVTSYDVFDTSMNGMDAPRWLFPSELDISNFFYLTPNPPSSGNIESFFGTRFNTNTPSSSRIPWFGGTFTRYDFWQNAGRLWNNYGANYKAWNSADDLELRYRNGLNNASVDATIETSGINGFLRQSSGSESTWSDWDGVGGTTNADMLAFFEDEPRHQMTAFSGAANYAMRLYDESTDVTFNGTLRTADTSPTNGLNDDGYLLKKNINTLLNDQDKLAFEIFKVLYRGTGSNAFKGFSAVTDYENYINQFVASLADHVDEDNWITTYNSFNGTEAWPAITEVYTQRPVQVTAFAAGSGISDKMVNLTGSPVGTTGYAIELINPHTKPIPITDIYIKVTYTDTSATPTTKTVYFQPNGSTNATRLTDIVDVATGGKPNNAVKHANHGDNWLYPGQKIIIYHSSTSGPSGGDTSSLLDGRDNIPNFIFEPYSAWTNGTSYSVGDLAYKVYNDGVDNYYAVYECLVAHVASAARTPDDSAYTHVSGHDYWRRKIIAVDGGAWPVSDSDFDSTKKVSIHLTPGTQASGGVSAASFPYQTVSVSATNSSDSISETDVAFDIAQFVLAASYNVGDLVRSISDYRVYKCNNVTGAGDTDPATPNPSWTLITDNDYFYAQTNAVGSVDGLEAFAIKDNDFIRNDSESHSPVAPHSFFFAQIGKVSKHDAFTAWATLQPYAKDMSIVSYNSKFYACIQSHTSQANFTDDADKWVEVSSRGMDDPLNGIRSTADQLLMTDMRASHLFWQDGQTYAVGDVVRGLNDTRTYMCVTAHTATAADEPASTGSSNWEEHWRSASDGYKVSSVTELAQVHIAGPSSGKTLSDVLGDSAVTSIKDLMLPFDTTAVVGTGNMAIPHGLALMQRLTVNDPTSDTVDNDGDGDIDSPTDSDELMVPGTININTAPAHLLKKILPLPQTTSTNTYRDDVVNALIDYRDLTSGRLSSWRSAPGFASVGEIYRALQQSGTQTRLQSGSFVGDTDTINGTLIDFDNVSPNLNDSIADDREEELLYPRMLMSMTSARSDVFTAFILIRGYPTGDFTKGAVESKRMIAVFDRSNLDKSTAQPKLIGLYEYP